MSHDQNFKNLILDYPHESIHFFAAVEAQAIDTGARIHELGPAGDVDAESLGLLCYTYLMGITQSWLFAPKLFSLAGRRDFFRAHLHGMLGLSR